MGRSYSQYPFQSQQPMLGVQGSAQRLGNDEDKTALAKSEEEVELPNAPKPYRTPNAETVRRYKAKAAARKAAAKGADKPQKKPAAKRPAENKPALEMPVKTMKTAAQGKPVKTATAKAETPVKQEEEAPRAKKKTMTERVVARATPVIDKAVPAVVKRAAKPVIDIATPVVTAAAARVPKPRVAGRLVSIAKRATSAAAKLRRGKKKKD